MRHIKSLILVILLLLPTQVFAWEKILTFEGGTEGQPATGTNSFTEAGARTLFNETLTHSGTTAVAMNWLQSDDGFTNCNGNIGYTTPLVEGDEIWVRGYFYFPPGFDFTATPVCKVLRIKVVDDSPDDNAGYHSIFFGGNDGVIVLSNELAGVQTLSTAYLDTGAWQALEIYVNLSLTNPIFRIWKDGILVLEDTTSKTWTSVGEGDPYSAINAPFSYVMSYWNGGSPVAQTQYLDDFIATDDQPTNQDASGNYMIGPDDWAASGETEIIATGTVTSIAATGPVTVVGIVNIAPEYGEWDTDNSTSYTDDVYTFTSLATYTTMLREAAYLTEGTTYATSVTVVVDSGSVRVDVGSVGATILTSSGTYVVEDTATSDGRYGFASADTGFSGTLKINYLIKK